jgi:FixJ family two-component response regulator
LVCVVDDDDAILEGISGLLQVGGYRVSVFKSAEALLVSDDRRAMRCLVTDVTLPGLSGLELQRQLNEQHVLAPIIVMTAQPEHVLTRALAQGAFAALSKPFTGAQRCLLDVVADALQQTKCS